LNYQPNWIARSLVTKRTGIIGVVVPDLMHSFFTEIAKGIAATIRAKGYHLLISNSEGNPQIEKQEIETLLARRVDGLIVAPCQGAQQTEVFERAAASRIPYVLVERKIPNLDAHFVGWEQEALGFLATKHLIDCGCRRIAHIRGPEIETGIGRLEGYRCALENHHIRVPNSYVVRAADGDGTGYDAMRKLLNINPLPDGVFCYKDPIASYAIKAILEAGLKVPDDIAVIGVGNIQYSDMFQVPLSTIDQSSRLMGERAAELLLDLMSSKRHGRSKRILIPPKLVVRQSTRKSGLGPEPTDADRYYSNVHSN
jgi:LacI family transcriptional regulator